MTVAESIEARRELPKGWRWARLGELGEYINGMAFKPEDWRTTGLPIIRIQNLNDPSASFNCYDGDVPERYKVNDGDLLISWSASLDAYIWRRGKAILNQHIFRVEENTSVVTREYLYFAVREAMDEIRSQVHGATMRHITKPGFEAILIPLPPLPEQRRIAALLSEQMAAVERARASAEARLEAARALPAAYLREVFEGEEARGWKRVALARVCSIGTGTTPSTNNPEYYRGTIPFVKTAEVVNNRIFAAETHISSKAVRDFNMRLYPKGTVLLAMYGQGKTRGQVGLLEIDATTTQNAAAIVPGEQLDSEYLWLWLQSLYENLRRMGFQGDLSHLSLGYIKALEVPLPSVVVQRRVVAALLDYLKSTEVAITSLQAQLDTINTLSAALLRQAFNGEL